MKSKRDGNFYLLVSEPVELPSHEYLIALNVDAESGQLDEIDSVKCLIEPGGHEVCFTDLDGQLLAEIKLEDWQKKVVHTQINLKSGKFLECSVGLANEEQKGVFVGKKESADPKRKKDKKVVVIERLENLVDLIKGDMELLSDYENRLRYENDPSDKRKYQMRIQELHKSIDSHQQEYDELMGSVATEMVSVELSEKMKKVNELREAHIKLDQLLKEQRDVRGDISKLKLAIVSCLEVNEQRIIAALMDRLEQSELVVVNAVLNGVDTMGVTADRIGETLTSVRETLVEVRDQKGAVSDPILSKTAGKVLEVIDDPKLDVTHRLKVTVPIIPVILKYEGIVDIKSGLNLEKVWKWLVGKVQWGK